MLARYIAPPTFVALINPHKGKFNVTAKGGLVEEEYVDWVISRPYIYLVLLNLVGVAVGIWRFMYGPENEILTVWVSIVWVFYNLIILGGAVAVSVESKQVRRSHRVEMSMPAAIAREDGHLFSCTVHDYSDGGLGIKINGDAQVLEGQNAAAAQTGTAGVCLPGQGRAGQRQRSGAPAAAVNQPAAYRFCAVYVCPR